MSNKQDLNTKESKQCWVCFATDEDDFAAQWVSPCKCRGTAKWVHKICLERWIDEKQHGNSTVDVQCPQCNTKYVIVYPKSDVLIKLIEKIDQIINKLCPYVATCVVIGSVYWTTVTYGAMTVMQVLDQKDAFQVMDQADPLIMLLALPTIPIMLVLCRFIKWEEFLLKYWRKYSNKFPFLNFFFQTSQPLALPRVPTTTTVSSSDPVSLTRTFCGGLMAPTMATLFGKFLFKRVHSNFQRCILGGISYLTLKGALRMYYQQKQYFRQAHRKIIDLEEDQQQQVAVDTNQPAREMERI